MPMLSMQKYSALVQQYSHPDSERHDTTPYQHAHSSGQYGPANTNLKNNPVSPDSLQSPPISDESMPQQEGFGMDEESRSSWSRGRESSSMELERNVKIHRTVYPDSEPVNTSSSSTTYSFALISSPDVDVKLNDVIPKIEEVDDDDEEGTDLSNIKPSEDASGSEAANNADSTPAAPRKKRGRPRKHPLPVPGGNMKIAKGRSKTGCITCRRRKKKCDETKPACLNCQKNAVVCEGYPQREIWKSGKQKMEDGI